MRHKKRFIIGPKEKEIIQYIGTGVLVLASLAIPTLPMALKPFIETEHKKKNFKKIIKKLAEKNVVYLGGERIKLTKNGKALFKQYQFKDIEIKKSKKWNGVWHVIAYDIPDKFKKERDYFRKKLLDSNFEKLQESLMVFPYECKDEIVTIAQCLKISPFVIYLNTKQLPRQEYFIKKFNL